jgi:hypothetical protein
MQSLTAQNHNHSLMKIALRLALLVFVVTPLLAWFIVKPVRVVAPQVLGLYCPRKAICVESVDALPQATALYSEALAFVRGEVGLLERAPTVVFCSTQACADQFGLAARSAVTLGTVGTVIGPHAWKPTYVRHELIHHLQGQKFGVLRCMTMPTWLIEGMAYSLSQDTRARLAQPWQGYREQFDVWLLQVGRARMWQEAARL